MLLHTRTCDALLQLPAFETVFCDRKGSIRHAASLETTVANVWKFVNIIEGMTGSTIECKKYYRLSEMSDRGQALLVELLDSVPC